MSELQEKAVSMIGNMTDDKVQFVIDFMQQLDFESDPAEKMRAFEQLEELRKTAAEYLPPDFDYENARDEAMREKYGSIA